MICACCHAGQPCACCEVHDGHDGRSLFVAISLIRQTSGGIDGWEWSVKMHGHTIVAGWTAGARSEAWFDAQVYAKTLYLHTPQETK